MQFKKYLDQVHEDGMKLKDIPTDKFTEGFYQIIANEAVIQNAHAIQFVPYNLQLGIMANNSISGDGITIQYVAPHLRKGNYKLHEKAIRKNFMALAVINPHDGYLNYADYKDLALLACRINMTAKDFIRKDLPGTLYEEIILEIIKENVNDSCLSLFDNIQVIAPNSYLITDLTTGDKQFVKGTTIQKAFKTTYGHDLVDNGNLGYYLVENTIYHRHNISVEKKDWLYRTYTTTETVITKTYEIQKIN